MLNSLKTTLPISQKYFYAMITVLLLMVVSSTNAEVKNQSVQATVIHFSEYEQGSGQYPVTMSITPEFLRIDDTKEGKDFVLLDRKADKIFSVNSEDQQIIQIKLTPVTIPSPVELNIREETMKMDENAPLIAGKKASHHQFYVNEKLCYEVIAVPGLMPDSVAAMKKFKNILAGQQSETLRHIPGDLQEPCDLVKHTFHPELYLSKGFPVIEKEFGQIMLEQKNKENVRFSRAMINFKEEAVDLKRFILPEDYQLIPIN